MNDKDFSMSLQLGFGGLLLIASLTDHCCHLIVKTKYHAIEHVIKLYKANKKSSASSSSAARNSGSEMFSTDEDEEFVVYDVDEVSMMEQHMLKHMSYGDVGQVSMGKVGRVIVNICIGVTQFCFCVGYSIFLGNTIYSLFPSEVCNNAIANVDNVSLVASVESNCELHHLGQLPSSNIKHSKRSVGALTNSSYQVQFGENTTLSSLLMTTDLSSGNLTELVTGTISNVSLTTEMPYSNVTSWTMANVTGSVIQSTAPSLKLLVLAPLPIFLLFALFRNVRKMGFISVIANISVFVGSASVFLYLVVGKLRINKKNVLKLLDIKFWYNVAVYIAE